jgi:hypothetical protein
LQIPEGDRKEHTGKSKNKGMMKVCSHKEATKLMIPDSKAQPQLEVLEIHI